jgi:hypothetical protein
MRLVSKLSVPNEPSELPYASILLREGVYKPVGYDNARLIVLHGVGSAPSPLVLWKHGSSTIEPADEGWEDAKFIFISDTLVLETL